MTVAIAFDPCKIHTDAGAEAGEEEAAGAEDAPEFGEHGAEVMLRRGRSEGRSCR